MNDNFNNRETKAALDRVETWLEIKSDVLLVAFAASSASMQDIIKEAATRVRQRLTEFRGDYQKQFDEL